jgi:hypothetical protein
MRLFGVERSGHFYLAIKKLKSRKDGSGFTCNPAIPILRLLRLFAAKKSGLTRG